MVATLSPSLWFVVFGLVVAAGGTLLLAVYTARNTDGELTLQAFTILLTLLFLWTAGEGGRLLAESIGGKIIWHNVLYIGVVGVPVAWAVFSLLYAGHDRYVRRESVGALLVVPLVNLAALFTNPLHGVFYEATWITYVGPTPIFRTVAGPLWWLHLVYSYLLVGLGFVVLVRFAMRTEDLYRAQSAGLIVGALVPIAANAVFIFGVLFDPVLDLTPLAFALSSLLLFVTIFYGRFLDLVPVANEAVVRTLEDGILVVDEEGQIVNANAAAARMLTDEPDSADLVGSELATLEPTLGIPGERAVPSTAPSVSRGFEAASLTDGEIQWFWVRRVDLTTATRKSGTVVTLTDITDKKRFERQLRKLQRTHQQLIVADTEAEIADTVAEAAKDVLDLPITGVWKHDPDRSVLDPVTLTDEASEVFEEPPAFEHSDSLAWDVFETGEFRTYTDLDDRDDVQNPDTPLEAEILVPLGDWGLMASGSTTQTTFRDLDFDLVRVLAVAVESAVARTEREQRIRALQRRTSTLIRAASAEEIAEKAVETTDEVLGLPLSGVHLLASDDPVLEPTALTDTVVDTFDSPPVYRRDADHPVDSAIWEVFETGTELVVEDTAEIDIDLDSTPVESFIVHPLGDHGVFVTSSPEPNALDRTEQALVDLFATTVTAALDRVERERKLRRRERDLERQNERLEEFTSVVSHDLRSPLNQVNVYLELLESDHEDERIESARDANERAREMIKDLLALARQGKTVEETETKPLETTVENAWRSVPSQRASVDIDGDLGAVAADHSRVRQVFENLFRNAVEHGGDQVRIEVGRLDGEAGVYVADDGPGVPEELRDEVFDHGYTTNRGGTGFGLAIVQRIVAAHDWQISMTDSADGGARFEISGMASLSDPSVSRPEH